MVALSAASWATALALLSAGGLIVRPSLIEHCKGLPCDPPACPRLPLEHSLEAILDLLGEISRATQAEALSRIVEAATDVATHAGIALERRAIAKEAERITTAITLPIIEATRAAIEGSVEDVIDRFLVMNALYSLKVTASKLRRTVEELYRETSRESLFDCILEKASSDHLVGAAVERIASTIKEERVPEALATLIQVPTVALFKIREALTHATIEGIRHHGRDVSALFGRALALASSVIGSVDLTCDEGGHAAAGDGRHCGGLAALARVQHLVTHLFTTALARLEADPSSSASLALLPPIVRALLSLD